MRTAGFGGVGSAIFAEDTARRRLLFLLVLEADDSHSGAPRMEWERIHFIHSMLNLEASEQAGAPPCSTLAHDGRALWLASGARDGAEANRVAQVRAAGALMAIMQRDGLCAATTSIDHEGNSQTAIQVGAMCRVTSKKPRGYGRADVRALDVVWALWQVTSVSECGLKGMLMLDAQSYAALQVFHEERHPSAMGLGKAKEGLSMYGVLNQCVSAPGRALLRLWLARPLVDLSAIIARQVNAALRPGTLLILDTGVPCCVRSTPDDRQYAMQDAVAFLMVNTDVTSSLQSSLKHSRDLRKVQAVRSHTPRRHRRGTRGTQCRRGCAHDRCCGRCACPAAG